MTVRLKLDPDVERSLSAQAQARGISLDAYLQHIVEDLARSTGNPKAGVREFRAALDLLSEMGRNLPQLPPDAFSRESIYESRG